jgi:parallel beta-helix repeat protein
MSRHLKDYITRRATLTVLLALLTTVLVASTLVAADHPVDQDANNGGTGQTDWTGEWTIASGDDLEYANQTILLDGNLNISNGGRLVLKNVTLVLHSVALSPQEILIHGELVVTDLDGNGDTTADRSMLKANDTDYPYYFQAWEDASLTLTNSRVENCGELFNVEGYQTGLYIATTDATVEDTEFTAGYGGLFIDGVSITVSGLNIHDNDWYGIYVDNNANPTIVDCTIEDNHRGGVMVKTQSDPAIISSSIRGNLRGIVVDGALLSAEDTAISDNVQVDLELVDFSQAELLNCSVSTSTVPTPVRMENSSLTSTHGNFDIDKVDLTASTYHFQQLLTVAVTWSDSVSTPIPDVPITIVDAEDQVYLPISTGEDGMAANIPVLVMEYDKTGPTLRTFAYNPFHVTVIHNLIEQDAYVDLRYDNAKWTFQYHDVIDPIAVAPGIRETDVGATVTLDGSASQDNVAIDEWAWSFEELGEPVILLGETVEYVFKQAKVYTITLTIKDTSGRTGPGGVVTFDVNAQDRSPPTADAGPDIQVEQGETVIFDGSASADNVGVVAWTWSFTYNDAPRSLTGVSQSFTFETAATYIVALTVEDASGLSSSTSITVTVEDTIPPTTVVTLDPEPGTDRKFDEIVQVLFTVSGEPAGTVDLFYRINDGELEKITGGLALDFGGDLQYGDGTYEIEYYAVDLAGNAEEVRTISAFTVDATTPTFSNMDPPITPFTVAAETYTISGKTEPGVTLTVNSQIVTVAEDGTFSYEAALELGENSFFIIAEDGVGNSADTTVVIERKKYGNGPTDDGGISAGIFGGVALAIIIVLIVLYYMFVMRKKEEGPGSTHGPPSQM